MIGLSASPNPPAAGNVAAKYFNGIGLYQALLTQAGTDAPTAKVLANNLEKDLVWSYVTTGVYAGTLAGAFTADKTAVLATPDSTGVDTNISATRTSADVVTVTVAKAGAVTDALLTNSFIEIKIFP